MFSKIVYISAGQQLILINRIQNKSFCLYNTCVCTVYIYYVYIKTHIQYIFRKYLHVYIYINIIYIIYKYI